MTSVAHQWLWMSNIKEALDFLRRMNTSEYRVTGKTFGELIDYFVVRADEACLMADQHGNVKIIGAADKKKHARGRLVRTGALSRCFVRVLQWVIMALLLSL
jgi:hypothetical protein